MNAQKFSLKLEVRPTIRTRSPRELLIVGLDDTLIDTTLYWLAREAFARAGAARTANAENNIVPIFQTPDSQCVYEAVPADTSITVQDAWLVFRKLCDPPLENDATDACLAMARSLRGKFPTLMPGAEDLLKWAKPHFTMALLASGNSAIQTQKIEGAKLKNFFNTVKIVPSKRKEDFLALFSELGFSPRNSWVLGDSIRSDINPALAAGANCIHFTPPTKRLGAPGETEEPSDPIFRLHELLDARAILAKAGPSLAAC